MTPRWLDQVESLARESLPEPVFRYVAEGAREEISVREAVEAWRSIRVAPRVLRDVRHVETGIELLDRPFTVPIGIAPMTLQRAAHPDGEIAMATAAAGSGVPLVLSSNAGTTFTDIGSTGAAWWLQAYLRPDRADSGPLLAAAVEAGASAVVLTADTPVVGTRYASSIWETADPAWAGANLAESGGDPSGRPKAMDLGPADIEWLARTTGLPVVVKGVCRPEDARLCVEAGASAVWISNHGGRQLDQTLATAHSIGPVRAAVGDTAQVYVDGGVRSGLHAMLAVALGADAVFVGRPLFHALAAGGPAGVAQALTELGEELVEAMRLGGCATLAETRGIACADGRFGLQQPPDLRERGV